MNGTEISIQRPLASLCVAVVVLLGAPAAEALASGAPESARLASSAAEVREYWSAARMRAAEPVEVPVAAGPPDVGMLRASSPAAASYVPAAGAPRVLAGVPGDDSNGVIPGDTRDEILDPSEPEFRPHGKVFFTVATGEGAGDYVCSATAVNSRNRSAVWTAGHCVFPEGGTEFVSNWTFVPAYHEGAAPFGEWPAKRLATTGPWQAAANLKYDLGAAAVRRSATGEKLQDVIGARGIGFDQPRDQTYSAFGYPAVPPPLEFSGEREFRCTSPPVASDEPGTTGPQTIGIECDMTGGSSGGGWVAGTTLLSVTSYGYRLEFGQLYGAYMSSSAKALYRGVSGRKPKPKSPDKPGGAKGSKG